MNVFKLEFKPGRAFNLLPGKTADTVGHGSIQPWSAGDIFPAVIARIEVYETHATPSNAREQAAADAFYARPLADRLIGARWEVTLNGVTRSFNGTGAYDACVAWARQALRVAAGLPDPDAKPDLSAPQGRVMFHQERLLWTAPDAMRAAYRADCARHGLPELVSDWTREQCSIGLQLLEIAAGHAFRDSRTGWQDFAAGGRYAEERAAP